MEPAPKLSKHARRLIAQRLRAFWQLLKARVLAQAADDLARAEEQYRGRNEPPVST
jgi:hypothetical protein